MIEIFFHRFRENNAKLVFLPPPRPRTGAAARHGRRCAHAQLFFKLLDKSRRVQQRHVLDKVLNLFFGYLWHNTFPL
jgi:hypothetical protein